MAQIKLTSCFATVVASVMAILLATVSSTDAVAQAAPAVYEAQLTQSTPPARHDQTKTAFNESNAQGWGWVATQCSDTTSDACAAAAVVQVHMECGASSKFFKKDTKGWTILGFSMVIASAVFTGVGASTTISSAKVWSTLGGTTGLGAVTSNVNANASADQAGLATVNTTLANFLKFVQTGGTNNAPPANNLIYKSAPIYAAQCAAAANGSPGTGSK